MAIRLRFGAPAVAGGHCGGYYRDGGHQIGDQDDGGHQLGDQYDGGHQGDRDDAIGGDQRPPLFWLSRWQPS